MAYIINQTNGQIVVTLADGTANGPDINPGQNIIDINLFGKNYPAYGEFQNENFVKLLQNFANNTAPLKPLTGELWYDTSTGFLKIYNGSAFRVVASIIISAIQPVSAYLGDQWWDTKNDQLKSYNGANWVTVGPAYSKLDGISGVIPETVYDSLGAAHTVDKIYTNGNVIAIASYDVAFTPNVSIAGFTTINPGITLNINADTLFYGTATNAQQLANVDATSYARLDTTQTFVSNINFGNGNVSINSVAIDSTDIVNHILNANLSIYNNVSGVSTRTLHINGSTGLVSVASDPIGNLEVATKQYVDIITSAATIPLAPISSPVFTGNPQAPTPSINDSDNSIATTGFVQQLISTTNTGLWKGSNKFVSNVTPTPFDGVVGDFWFQI